MGTYTKQLSSWRKHLIEIAPNQCKTYTFFDTKPNMIFIQNPCKSPLLVSLESMPTIEKYDWKIKGNYGRCVGRPYGTQQIYIINTSDEHITVPMWSISDNFQFSILQDFTLENLTIDGEQLKNLQFDGIVKGFEEALPSGSNVIGKVGLDDNATKTLNAMNNRSDRLIVIGDALHDRTKEIKENQETFSTDFSGAMTKTISAIQQVREQCDLVNQNVLEFKQEFEQFLSPADAVIEKNRMTELTIDADNFVKIINVTNYGDNALQITAKGKTYELAYGKSFENVKLVGNVTLSGEALDYDIVAEVY